jgi:pyoverdine/dityrosine biosynthesis protein Dit1
MQLLLVRFGARVFDDLGPFGDVGLDELGEFYTTKLQTMITRKALEEVDEVFIFEEKRIQKDAILSEYKNSVKKSNHSIIIVQFNLDNLNLPYL